MLVDIRAPVQRNREDIDEKAKRLVLEAYHEGCSTKSQTPFDAALNSYMARYPHVSRELAGYAVAHILATAGI
jgi:hypothetical protein